MAKELKRNIFQIIHWCASGFEKIEIYKLNGIMQRIYL